MARAGEWRVTVRLGGAGAGLEVAVDGLTGSTLVSALLLRACAASGVLVGDKAALRCDSRRLQGEDSLVEAGVETGGILDVWVGERGGMEQSRASQHPAASAADPCTKGFSEEDDDEELDELFRSICVGGSDTILLSNLTAALEKRDFSEDLVNSLLKSLSASARNKAGITRQAFSQALKQLPRVRGERVKWARGLGLEVVVAKLLPMGDIFDGLKGLRALTDAEIPTLVQSITKQLALDVPRLIGQKIRELQKSEAGEDAALSQVNSKFSMDGAYVGRFATLDDFYRGPEKHIGTPNPKIMEGIQNEHCRRSNSVDQFTTTNYNIVTYPSLEYEFVVAPEKGKVYPHTPSDRSKWRPMTVLPIQNPGGWKGKCGRDPIALDAFIVDAKGQPDAGVLLETLPESVLKLVRIAREEITKSGLKREEVAGLRLYTGPMFFLYNAVLRRFPEDTVKTLKGNWFETTIFAITSGITKLSKVSVLPKNRLLYRGLGGMILPRQFWDVYEECIVAFKICAKENDKAKSAMDAVQRNLIKSSESAKAYDINTQYLNLPLPDTDEIPEALRKEGIRVASPPCEASSSTVSLALAVPVTKFYFKQHLSAAFKQALSALCEDCSVDIIDVAAKPSGFCGGGALPPTHPLFQPSLGINSAPLSWNLFVFAGT